MNKDIPTKQIEVMIRVFKSISRIFQNSNWMHAKDFVKMVEENQKIVDRQYNKIQENIDLTSKPIVVNPENINKVLKKTKKALQKANSVDSITMEYIRGEISVREARKKLDKLKGIHLVKIIDKNHAKHNK